MGQYMRYYADAPVGLDVIKKTLAAEDPSFKIDGGEVSRGGQVLAELEITRPGSDMFSDDISTMIQKLRYADGNAPQVMARVQNTQAVVTVQILEADAMQQLAPFWSVLSRISNGLWHVEGQGFYDQGQLVVRV